MWPSHAVFRRRLARRPAPRFDDVAGLPPASGNRSSRRRPARLVGGTPTTSPGGRHPGASRSPAEVVADDVRHRHAACSPSDRQRHRPTLLQVCAALGLLRRRSPPRRRAHVRHLVEPRARFGVAPGLRFSPTSSSPRLAPVAPVRTHGGDARGEVVVALRGPRAPAARRARSQGQIRGIRRARHGLFLGLLHDDRSFGPDGPVFRNDRLVLGRARRDAGERGSARRARASPVTPNLTPPA